MRLCWERCAPGWHLGFGYPQVHRPNYIPPAQESRWDEAVPAGRELSPAWLCWNLETCGRRCPLGLGHGTSHKRGFCDTSVIRNLTGHPRQRKGWALALSCLLLPALFLRDRQQAQQLGLGRVSTERDVHRDGTGAQGAPCIGISLPGMDSKAFPRFQQKWDQRNMDRQDGTMGNMGQSGIERREGLQRGRCCAGVESHQRGGTDLGYCRSRGGSVKGWECSGLADWPRGHHGSPSPAVTEGTR